MSEHIVFLKIYQPYLSVLQTVFLCVRKLYFSAPIPFQLQRYNGIELEKPDEPIIDLGDKVPKNVGDKVSQIPAKLLSGCWPATIGHT